MADFSSEGFQEYKSYQGVRLDVTDYLKRNIQIKYGTASNNIDVTQIALEKCLANNILSIPNGDNARATIFTDPCFGVKKSIFIKNPDSEPINDSEPTKYNIGLCFKIHVNSQTNQERYKIIETFLESIKILLNFYNNLTVVAVIDTIPTDRLKECLLKIDNRIKILYLNENFGISFATNIGIEYLLKNNCDYIFCSDDDIIFKDEQVLNVYINAMRQTNINHFCYYPSYFYKRIELNHIFVNNTYIMFYTGGYSGCFYCFHKDVIFNFGYLPILNAKYGYEHEILTKKVTRMTYDIIDSEKYVNLNVNSLNHKSNNSHELNTYPESCELPKFIDYYYWFNQASKKNLQG